MNRFDIVLGHYVFCSLNHSGQASGLYARLSRISGYFTPTAAFSETRFFDLRESEYEEARTVYRKLCEKHRLSDPFRTLIAVDRDEGFAPGCFILCRVTNPWAGPSEYDWDHEDEKNTVLIQSDWDFSGVARTFGWAGEESDIQGASAFLDRCVEDGKVVEDPGYFSSEPEGGK